MLHNWWSFFFVVFIYQYRLSEGTGNGKILQESNICSHLISYEEEVIIPVTDFVKEYYTTWCLSFPPRCTTFRMKSVNVTKTINVNKTKTVFDCCKGYEKISGSCFPICRFGCNHGECVEPDKCLCYEGWKGTYCDLECEPRKFGRGCENYCSCMHGATCDPRNGFCNCTEGYIGSLCEFPCPNNTYGLHCKNKCKCQNGALCNVRDGSCDCQPGYSGDYCENMCDAGTHGSNCVKTCVCLNENTEYCSHTDGKCICKVGYKGEYCNEECDNFTFGLLCESHCKCENSNFCDHITGECLCKPGWIGEKCAERCKIGTFGENCKFKCLPCHNGSGVCNHETGNCECPPGSTGESCDLPCPEDYWGLNCSLRCNCLNGGICHTVTGECLCLPGWIGQNCSQPCDPGSYGFNCSVPCTCSPNATCDPEDGMCTCFDGYTGSDCEQSLYGDLTPSGVPYIGLVWTTFVIFLLFTIITVLFCYYSNEHCQKSFPRKLECIERGRSMDIIVNDNFSNPPYEGPESANVQISVPEPESQFYAAIEIGRNETEGLQRLKAFINQLADDKCDSEDIRNLEKNACQRSSSERKQEAMNNISVCSSQASSNGNIRKQSKKSNINSCNAASVQDEEGYEPESLCEFFIVEENIYENVRYSKTLQKE